MVPVEFFVEEELENWELRNCRPECVTQPEATAVTGLDLVELLTGFSSCGDNQ